jgi:hypothetical protein
LVIVLAGLNDSPIVDAALADSAVTDAAVLRFEPGCSAPCDALLWRLETQTGACLNQPGLLRRHWHRPPYAMTVRLVQYRPGGTTADILDEGTIGTRGSKSAFLASADRLSMRMVRDAVLGRSRGPADAPPAALPSGAPGWVNRLRTNWQARLMTEWWSLGTSPVPLHQVLGGGPLSGVHWYSEAAGSRYFADPFPWPGTGRILCEDMPIAHGPGRIVSVSEAGGELSPAAVVLDDGLHHSYPCTLADNGQVYCVPETTERGATRIYRLQDDGSLLPVCSVAPHSRLADPTLFRWNGRLWLACTDLDLGEHDNLCFMHADAISGPWMPHARWPVKIDVRGARPAGSPLKHGGRLFRPAQDCAATYGAAVALHEVVALTETDFAEKLVNVLRPDKAGPFPNGLHTLVHDGERFWIDGKRFVFNFSLFRRKLADRAARLASIAGVG